MTHAINTLPLILYNVSKSKKSSPVQAKQVYKNNLFSLNGKNLYDYKVRAPSKSYALVLNSL